MSEYAADPADVQEQEQALDVGAVPEPDLAVEEDEDRVDVPDDANEADVLEQNQPVPEDDEDYRE